MGNDAFDKLEERKSSGDQDWAEWWEPEEGDELIGVIVEMHEYQGPGADGQTIRTVRSVGRGDLDEGEERSTPVHKALLEDLGETEVGDVVLLQYDGKVETDSGMMANTYQTSVLTQEEWQQTDQSDDFMDVWENSPHFNPVAVKSRDDDSGGSSDGLPQDAVDFAGDVLSMNDGEVTFDELDEYLNEIRDYDVDTEAVIEANDDIEQDGDTVVQQD